MKRFPAGVCSLVLSSGVLYCFGVWLVGWVFLRRLLLLYLIPLLTVICLWLITLLHCFLGVWILLVPADGYQIPILLSQSV